MSEGGGAGGASPTLPVSASSSVHLGQLGGLDGTMLDPSSSLSKAPHPTDSVSREILPLCLRMV